MTQETELIFRTAVARADTRPAFPYTQIDLPRTDGARQFAWRLDRAAEGTNGHGSGDWVLYLHGNASTVASRMNVKHYTRLHELGVNVLAPEYRGYNGLPGVPSEATVVADARAAYRLPAQRRRRARGSDRDLRLVVRRGDRGVAGVGRRGSRCRARGDAGINR